MRSFCKLLIQTGRSSALNRIIVREVLYKDLKLAVQDAFGAMIGLVVLAFNSVIIGCIEL
jgi:hypothetical protein